MQKTTSEETEMRQIPADAFKKVKKNSKNYSSQEIELRAMQETQKSVSNQEIMASSEKALTQKDRIQESQADDGEGSESQNEQIQKQADDIIKELKAREAAQKGNKKVIVGGGFTFDITEFFKFEKKKMLDSTVGDIFSQISGSILAWVILLYSVCNSAMIPSWIMNIHATKLLRISWRFLMQTFMIFPFVLYEYRVSSQEVKNQYSLRHIFKPEHLKKVYISSISTSIWFTFILTVFEWTFVSHGIALGTLSNFFLSIHRAMTNSQHDLEPGGRYCVILGIFLVMYDSYRLSPDMLEQRDYHTVNPFYIHRHSWQRMTADVIALCVSFVISKLSRYTADMKSHYPPYLSMLMVNFFMTINMAFSTYFFNGLTFDYHPRFGYFSIFSQEHFAGFMYMSIVLGFGMFVSFVMISKLFPDPILPALAMTLEPVIATILLQWSGIQHMPYAYTFIGYFFIIPGMMLILVGQCLYQRTRAKQNNQAQDEKKRLQIIKEIREMRLLKSIEEKRQKMRRVHSIQHEMEHHEEQSSKNIEMVEMNRVSKDALAEPLLDKESHAGKQPTKQAKPQKNI